MVIVGYDQAPRDIGFASGEPGSTPARGCRGNPDFGDNEYPLFKDVMAWGKNHMRSVGADVIFTEQIIVRKFGLHTPTLFKQVAVMLALHAAAGELGIDSFQADIGDWRREFYAGRRPPKGAESQSAVWKELAVQECLRRNWLVEDPHAAEACGIWFYGCIHSDRRFRAQHKVTARRAELKAWQAEAV